ncbi:MAG: hypothetical protein VKK62_05955 [Synechococcaceae cyanobacterium]|nr:hypothetical protein [Synechococcaceae cyanobacterium]
MTPADHLPDGPQLLQLEREARRRGTALEGVSLQGSWRLQRVWSRQPGRPAQWSSALLRGLAARLELQPLEPPAPGEGCGPTLGLKNAVSVGALELRFQGKALLEGRRPLLWLLFERWQLCLGSQTLLQGSMPPAPPQRRPFFALIGSRTCPDPAAAGGGVRWLAARGRGGGLALWTLDHAAAPAPALSGEQRAE